jgi:Terpene synthase family 2, C-terminal metal binding
MSMTPRLFRPGAEFYLPEFPYLLPALCHPDTEAIRRESDGWVRTRMRFALDSDAAMDRLLEEGAALWTCYVLPTADPDRLRYMCRYTEYLSVFDNAMVDRTQIGKDLGAAKALFDRVVNILNDAPDAADFEWGRVLRTLWGPMREGCSDRLWNRFMGEVQRFLSGCVSEIASRAEDFVFDYDTYLKVRRDSVGMGMYFVLGEYGLGIDLTDEVADGPLRELVDTALEHIMLTNDVFSFRAEAAMDDYVNAVAVLCLNEGMSLQDAIDRVFTVVEGKRVEFLARRAAIEATEWGRRPDIAAYLDALWHMMAGNLQWSYLTSRYNGVGHRWNGARSGVVTLHPDRTVFSDRPYRCLRGSGAAVADRTAEVTA